MSVAKAVGIETSNEIKNVVQPPRWCFQAYRRGKPRSESERDNSLRLTEPHE